MSLMYEEKQQQQQNGEQDITDKKRKWTDV